MHSRFTAVYVEKNERLESSQSLKDTWFLEPYQLEPQTTENRWLQIFNEESKSLCPQIRLISRQISPTNQRSVSSIATLEVHVK